MVDVANKCIKHFLIIICYINILFIIPTLVFHLIALFVRIFENWSIIILLDMYNTVVREKN